MFTFEDGEAAVRMARWLIEDHLGKSGGKMPEEPKVFKKNSGVFVTLNTYPDKDLRGCIGYSEPVMPLGKALKDVAISAATRDPRFPPVGLGEMDRITIDVTLLTPPEQIKYSSPEQLIGQVKIGKDGLIARRSFFSGLLLPQVPVEYGWSVEEFLSHTCMKAGLGMGEWKKGGVQFFKFSGRVFSESTPRGKVHEEELERGA